MKTLRQIKEELEIPAIGQTLSRDLMPQIDSAFLKYLKTKGISYTKEQLNTADLKSTQSEFDDMKILSLMSNNDTDPIFVSNDNYVLDGHHRWIADHNTDGKTEAYVIDLPILELLRVAKEYESMLKEEVTHKDFGPMMDAFVSFASDKLGIKSLPKINYKNDDEQGEQPSFGGYNPSSNEIIICTKNRHPMDVFRTLAHELVHHKQNEDGRIKDVSKEGSTGSPIEDEANSMAGRLMRWFGKANPDKFALSHIIEEFQSTLSAYSPQRPKSKTIGMEGGYASSRPGPGQDPKKPETWQVRTIQDYKPDDPNSYVTLAGNRKLYGKQVTIPSITYKTPEGNDVTYTNVRGHVHDTGKAFRKTGIERLDVAVGRDMPGNLGNQPFSMKSQTLRKGWDNSTQTPPKESPQPTQAKPNIPTGEPPAGSPQYKDAGHDADLMPKPSKPEQVKSQEPSPQSEPLSTPEQPVKRGITSGAIARAVRNQIQEKRNLNTEESLHKWFQSKSSDGKRGWVQIGGKYQGKPCARQPGQTSTPKCRSSDEASRMTKDEIKYAVTKKRREDPNQPSKTNAAKPTRVATYKEKNMNEEKDIKGKGSGKKDACYHKVKARYDVWPSAYASGALVKCRKVGASNWGKKSVDEEFSQEFKNKPENRQWGTKELAQNFAETTPGQKYPPPPMFPMNPLFEKKMKFVRKKEIEEGTGLSISSNSELNVPYTLPATDGIGPETGNRYASNIYGMSGTGSSLGIGYSPFGIPVAESTQPKSIKKLKESWDAIGGRDKGTVEKGTDEKKFFDEDWQKVNRQDKTDGLSQKAVNAYRRENPGSKLQTAVTEKNPKGKRAKRRLSFCRRMSGMKKRLTSAKTARDPDSRINKALRRWNCEE